MTTAFQSNAFQLDAFQIDASTTELIVDPTTYTTVWFDVTFEYNPVVAASPSVGVFGAGGKITGLGYEPSHDKPSRHVDAHAMILQEDEDILALLVAVVQSGSLNGIRY